VVIPHYSYISTGLEWARLATAGPTDIFFTALPLFHCSAQHMSTMGPLLNDLPAAYAEWFSASQFWAQAAHHGATITYLLIAMVNILYKQPSRPTDRQHSIRVCATAGTPRDIWQPFEERFGVHVIELYGMTETGCTTIMNPPERVRLGSVGLPTSYTEAKIVDEEDQELPPDTKGELVIRPRTPYSMMLEYYKKPEETVRAWRNAWFHTGDYAYQDADGYFYFVDRKRDIIRRRGENIAPYDIERVVNAHPHVFEAVAVAVPAEVGEEDVKLYVQLRPGKPLDPVELLRWCDERLPFFMVPRYIEFIDEIPRTANQKAQRHLLRERGIGQAVDREKLGYKPRAPIR
jgi:crotonobetaine/carnitine-CoA ligase